MPFSLLHVAVAQLPAHGHDATMQAHSSPASHAGNGAQLPSRSVATQYSSAVHELVGPHWSPPDPLDELLPVLDPDVLDPDVLDPVVADPDEVPLDACGAEVLEPQ